MYKNYENRVKDFVLDMTNPHSIVEHKDITEKITNTRAELMNELFSKNPEKRKPLIFRGYTTEADRIKDTIKNHKYLYYMPDYEKIKNERKKLKISSSSNVNISNNMNSTSLDKNYNDEKYKTINTNYLNTSPSENINNNNKNILISQPTMRFKPRTDLERVYDILNSYHCDEKPKEILERQLKCINLYDYKKPRKSTNSLGKNDDEDKKNEHSKKIIRNFKKGKKKKRFDLYKMNKIYYNPKVGEYKPWQRREDLNNEAYGLLSSYHYKTHFKAAEEIAESNYKYDKNQKNSVFLLPNLLPKLYKPKPIKSQDELEEAEDPFKFGEEDNNTSSENSDDYEDFDKNYNPLFKNTKTISDPEKMKILSKIAFKNKKSDKFNYKNDDENEENSIGKIRKNKKNRNYTEDNNIFINNKLYLKNSQFDKISGEILEMCNVYSTKSKFNNTSHKSKGGKTMITQGMTVREFEKKYRLEE